MMSFRKQFFWVLISAAVAGAPVTARGDSGRGQVRTRPAFSSAQATRTAFDRDDHRRGRDRDDRRWNGNRDNGWRDRDRDRNENRNRGYRAYPNYGYYPNNRNYGYYPYTYNYPNYNYYGYNSSSTYNLGYRDGVAAGRRDSAYGFGFNPRRYDRAGDAYYRAGFDAGYRDGFGR